MWHFDWGDVFFICTLMTFDSAIIARDLSVSISVSLIDWFRPSGICEWSLKVGLSGPLRYFDSSNWFNFSIFRSGLPPSMCFAWMLLKAFASCMLYFFAVDCYISKARGQLVSGNDNRAALTMQTQSQNRDWQTSARKRTEMKPISRIVTTNKWTNETKSARQKKRHATTSRMAFLGFIRISQNRFCDTAVRFRCTWYFFFHFQSFLLLVDFR